MPFGKETQEVVCVGLLIRSACLACNPLALFCIEIGYFVIDDTIEEMLTFIDSLDYINNSEEDDLTEWKFKAIRAH